MKNHGKAYPTLEIRLHLVGKDVIFLVYSLAFQDLLPSYKDEDQATSDGLHRNCFKQLEILPKSVLRVICNEIPWLFHEFPLVRHRNFIDCRLISDVL